jgi:hypothetical protein
MYASALQEVEDRKTPATTWAAEFLLRGEHNMGCRILAQRRRKQSS